MTFVAFAVRLVAVTFLYPERMAPGRDHYEFAYEVGRVARSIALGQGISNPLFGDTGPTALIPPVYPCILATIFRIFGVYTRAAALVALSLNALFSSLTCIPVYFTARRTFGVRVAMWAGWAWAFSPYAIYFSADWIWPTCLSTLLLSVLFLVTLHLEHCSRVQEWVGFGLLCGLAALNEPAVLSVLPFLAALSCFRRGVNAKKWLVQAISAALAFVLFVSPWFIRNYQVFHQFVPFRDGFGLELYVGNNGYTAHWANGRLRLSNNANEYAEYCRVGEAAFMAHKERQALDFIEEHPHLFAYLFLRRAVYLWTGYWSIDKKYLAEEPLDPPNMLLSSSLALLALAGGCRVFRNNRALAIRYAVVMLCFPIVYYVTHPEVYYLRSIDPFIALLATYAVIPGSRFNEMNEAGSKEPGLLEPAQRPRCDARHRDPESRDPQPAARWPRLLHPPQWQEPVQPACEGEATVRSPFVPDH
jgi:4-amino-4-deoxy-L-arabinose transferase-like glycosyltransferase